MATVIKECKVCGKRYVGCTTAEKYDGVFRYQTVTCSPECGAIYLARVMASRGISAEPQKTEPETARPAAEKKTRKRSVKKKEQAAQAEE